MPTWVRNVILTVAGAILAGGIELRVSMARVETQINDLDRRVERIEDRIAPKMAHSDEE